MNAERGVGSGDEPETIIVVGDAETGESRSGGRGLHEQIIADDRIMVAAIEGRAAAGELDISINSGGVGEVVQRMVGGVGDGAADGRRAIVAKDFKGVRVSGGGEVGSGVWWR